MRKSTCLQPKSSTPGINRPAIPGKAASAMLAMQYQLEQSQWWDAKQILRHQLDHLSPLLAHASQAVPFYRDHYHANSFQPQSGLTPDNWGNIPIVTHKQIQEAEVSIVSIVNLQILDNINSKTRNAVINQFDFDELVKSFDQSVASNRKSNKWSISNALLDAHLEQSNVAALGGDLTCHYGNSGSLTTVSACAAQEIMGDSSFGTKAQKLHDLPKLNGGMLG